MSFTTDGYKLLADELAPFRELSHGDLATFVGAPVTRRIRAQDSTEYAIEVSVRWRAQEGGDIVVDGWVAADDCGPVRRLDEQFVVPAP